MEESDWIEDFGLQCFVSFFFFFLFLVLLSGWRLVIWLVCTYESEHHFSSSFSSSWCLMLLSEWLVELKE